MTPDVVRDLHPPRLPDAFVATEWGDLLAAVGLGLLLAALILALGAPFLQRRKRQPRISDRIAAAALLPPQERLLVLVQILTERGGQLPEDLRVALYTPGAADPARIEALIRSGPRRPG